MLFSIVLAAIIALAMIPAASAFTATVISPADTSAPLKDGDVVKIQIDGLNAGDQFTYKISSADLQVPFSDVTLSNVDMPFGFVAGSATTTLTTDGFNPVNLDVTNLDTGTAVTLNGAPNIVSNININKAKYNLVMSGTKTKPVIGITYSVDGRVAGPVTNPVILSFTIQDIQGGSLDIEVLEGGVNQRSKTKCTVSSAIPQPNPTPDPAIGGGGGGGGGGAPSGGGQQAPQQAPQQQAPVEQLAPLEGTTPTTVEIQHSPEGQALADYVIEVVPSVDPATGKETGFDAQVDITKGTTITIMDPVTQKEVPVGEISVTPLDPASLPTPGETGQTGLFEFGGMAVECEPSGTQFTGGTATVSFSLNAEQWAAALAKAGGDLGAMTIQTYDPATKTWVEVPTVVDPVTHTVSAQVSHFSTYALFYKTAKVTAAPTPQSFGNLMTTTAAATAAPAGTTAAKAQLAPPEPTKSPALPGIVVIGVVGLVGYLVMRKD